MKQFLPVFLCLLLYQFAGAQKLELKELTELLDVPVSRLDNHLYKKGFKRAALQNGEEIPTTSFARSNKEGSLLQYCWLDSAHKLNYETTSQEESMALKVAMKNAGYVTPKNDSSYVQSLVYQKQVITIESTTRTEDSTVYYLFRAWKKDLPKKKDMLFAEDLLILDSHEYLSEMFGKSDVKTDLFYYTEDDSVRCSVLLPGTNREAIFIWKDQENLRKIEFIIIGGHLKGAQPALVQAFNGWRSRQGPYCGMSLQELEMINKGPVRFYNWQTESSGCLLPGNKGNINFARLGIVFHCMNCSFIKVSGQPVIDSTTAISEMQKIFISSLVILPE